MNTIPEVEFSGLTGLLFLLGTSLITLGVDALRRIVSRRLAIWEAKHPIPGQPEESNDEPTD